MSDSLVGLSFHTKNLYMMMKLNLICGKNKDSLACCPPLLQRPCHDYHLKQQRCLFTVLQLSYMSHRLHIP